MAGIVDRREKFVSDIMAMILCGTSNDVKIVLEDGEIVANKDVLSARSDYFATMFSNRECEFIEGETSQVTFHHCSKVIMEKIIQYLFSGNVKLYDLSLSDLVTMLNMTTMMMLDDLKGDIHQYILKIIPKSGVNCGFLPTLVESLILAEQFKLDIIEWTLISELYLCLGGIPHVPDVVKNSDAFKHLPFNLLDLIYLEALEEDEDEDDDDEEDEDDRKPTLKDLFYAFVFWLTENDCTEKEKEMIMGYFNFNDFTTEELLTDVKESGLYPIEDIHRRVIDIFRCQEKEILELKSKAVNK